MNQLNLFQETQDMPLFNVADEAKAAVIINAVAADINARHAFDWTSFSPEVRERQYIESYISKMQSVADEFSKLATDENVNEINASLERFRSGYAQRLNAYLAAHRRIASQAITGASGWTAAMVRRNDNANRIANDRNNELIEYTNKVIKKIKSEYDPTAKDNAPIMAGDPDAVSKLKAKIAEAETYQEKAKAANAAIRKHAKAGAEAQVKALVELGHTEAQSYKLLQKDFDGRVGYPDYALTNNNANIKRMKARVEEIERTQSRPTNEISVGEIRIVDNTEEARYQIFFPGKPSSNTIAGLKSNGYRWTPSKTCWQAYRNPKARAFIEEIKKGNIT